MPDVPPADHETEQVFCVTGNVKLRITEVVESPDANVNAEELRLLLHAANSVAAFELEPVLLPAALRLTVRVKVFVSVDRPCARVAVRVTVSSVVPVGRVIVAKPSLIEIQLKDSASALQLTEQVADVCGRLIFSVTEESESSLPMMMDD